jgi:hypothetical protein
MTCTTSTVSVRANVLSEPVSRHLTNILSLSLSLSLAIAVAELADISFLRFEEKIHSVRPYFRAISMMVKVKESYSYTLYLAHVLVHVQLSISCACTDLVHHFRRRTCR